MILGQNWPMSFKAASDPLPLVRINSQAQRGLGVIFLRKSCLIPILFVLVSIGSAGCSDTVEEDRFSAGEKRLELRRLAGQLELGEEMDSIERPREQGAAPEVVVVLDPSDDLTDRLDSSLASGDDEAALDYMLELEDLGGEVAVRGLGMVIDRALDEDLKLDAIASLSMMEEEDISAPLLRALDDQSEEVKIAALEVIADLELANLLSALRIRRDRGGDEETLEALEETIMDLEYLQEVEREN